MTSGRSRRHQHPDPDPLSPEPRRIMYTDGRGRVWSVKDLSPGSSRYFESRPWDATHRGFMYEQLRLIYKFRSGDDRGHDVETLGNQFAMAKRISTNEERAARAKPIALEPSTAERIQENYERRGMRRR